MSQRDKDDASIKAYLGVDALFKGTLSFEGTVRIDGKFEGHVVTAPGTRVVGIEEQSIFQGPSQEKKTGSDEPGDLTRRVRAGRGSGLLRAVATGQHPDGDIQPDPHITRQARQVDPREPSR